MSQKSRHLLIIHNPVSGRRKGLDPVLKALEKQGVTFVLRPTGAPGDAERFARDAAFQTDVFDGIVAAGGDGTINEVANGLVGSRMPLGIIPLGTANVLALEFKLLRKPEYIAHTLARGEITSMWPGLVNGRAFLLMVGLGFDAAAVERVTTPFKRRWGKLAYVWTAGAEWWNKRPLRYHGQADGVHFEAASVVVARSRHYGGPWICAPEAGLHTQDLHLVLFKSQNRAAILGYALALGLGRLVGWPGVRHLRAKKVDISPATPLQIDGDSIKETSGMLHLDVSDKPLRVIMPISGTSLLSP